MAQKPMQSKNQAPAGGEHDPLLRLAAELDAPHLVVAFPDGAIEFANPAAVRLLGAANSLQELAVSDSDSLVGHLHRVCQNHGSFDGMCGNGVPIRWSPVVCVGSRALVRVTDRSDDIERSLVRANAQFKVERAERFDALGRVTGVLAHEFNNLLAVILNHAELLDLESDLTDEARDDVAEIRNAALDGAEFTKRLLLFGRNDLAKPAFVPVADSIKEVVAEFNHTRGTSVSDDVRVGAASNVWVHPGQWRDAIVHLLENAVEAGGQDAPQLTVRSERVSSNNGDGVAEGDYVVVVVSDAGSGMVDDVARRATEPFFTTKSGLGSGLGLSLVYSVATGFGGNMTIDTTFGVGTRVTLFLPEHTGGDDEVEVPQAERSVAADAGVPTILVVEDEPGVLRAVQRILSAHGYELLVASSGAEALEVIESHDGAIDLLLTDVVMPGMSGVQLAKRVMRQLSDIRILYMSGYTESALSLDQLVAGKTDLILKPFTASDLLELIELHLGQ